MKNFRMGAWRAVAGLGLTLSTYGLALAVDGYNTHILVSDGSVAADHIDTELVNPWGISESGTSPFWISDNGKDATTVYNTTGVKNLGLGNIAVAFGTPTGTVFNKHAGAGEFHGDVFLFDTESGWIDGWKSGSSTADTPVVEDAVYKGLAAGTSAGGADLIYAAQFKNNGSVASGVEVFDTKFNKVGTFNDPGVAAGYAPFNVQVLGSSLYVTYAMSDGHDEIDGAGMGYVDVFNLDGTFNHRLVTGGDLNAPWGLAMAPSNFGAFSNDLLVGNFGDGKIHAFNPTTGVEVGTLADTHGNDLMIDGLWALQFGNGGNGGLANSLYFTAGPDGETHGVFGRIQSVPEPAPLLGLGVGLALLRRRKK
jgi:uncharacterized protein (TIGR03118 family)